MIDPMDDVRKHQRRKRAIKESILRLNLNQNQLVDKLLELSLEMEEARKRQTELYSESVTANNRNIELKDEHRWTHNSLLKILLLLTPEGSKPFQKDSTKDLIYLLKSYLVSVQKAKAEMIDILLKNDNPSPVAYEAIFSALRDQVRKL